MSNESDLDLLADGIEKLQDELIPMLTGEDKGEIEALLELTALLELALEAYTVIRTKVKAPTGAARRRSNRSSPYLQRH
jgi:hypothetical protein